MKTYLTGKLWIAQVRTKDFLKSLVTKENGDTNFVSIMLIIVIVIAIAAIFRDELANVVNNVMSGLSDATDISVGGGKVSGGLTDGIPE